MSLQEWLQEITIESNKKEAEKIRLWYENYKAPDFELVISETEIKDLPYELDCFDCGKIVYVWGLPNPGFDKFNFYIKEVADWFGWFIGYETDQCQECRKAMFERFAKADAKRLAIKKEE